MNKLFVYRVFFYASTVIVLSIIVLLVVMYNSQEEEAVVKKPEGFYMFCGTPNLSEEAHQGKELYSIHCTACHLNVFWKDNYLVTDGIAKKYPNDFLIKYITAEDSLVKCNDALTLKINKARGVNQYIHRFHLTVNETESILRYLDQTN